MPPCFERDLKARSRLAKSSYDYLFAKPALRWLLGDYFERGLNSVLFFAPPADPRVSVKAKIGSASFGDPGGAFSSVGGGRGGGGGGGAAAGGGGNVSVRYQPLGANEPSTFVDVKANPRVAGDVAVRACFFAPGTGLGAFAALPLSRATGRRGEAGLRYSSRTLAAGGVVQPSTGRVSGVWLAGRFGDVTAGVQVRPSSGPSAAFSRAPLEGWGDGGGGDGGGGKGDGKALTSSSSPWDAARWLRERASVAVAYTPDAGGDDASGRTRAGQPTFSAALEVVEGRAFCVSFFQRMAAVRRVFNPFEGSDVVGITNYVDVGLRLVMPLVGDEAGGGAGAGGGGPPVAAAPFSSSSAGGGGQIHLGAAWQVNRNIYLKGRLGNDGVALMGAWKSWYSPSLAVAASAEWRFRGGGARYGLVAQVENFGALRYERPRGASAAAHGGVLTQRHEATPAELAMAARERPLVPHEEAFGARNVEPASQPYM